MFRNVQETLSKCAGVNRPNGDAISSIARGICDRISDKGNIRMSPVLDAIAFSKSPDLIGSTENGNDYEKLQDHVNPLQNHDEMATGNVVKISSQLPSHSQWNGSAGRGKKRHGARWAETRNESNIICGAPVSANNLPVNELQLHETSNASIPAKIAQGDSKGHDGRRRSAPQVSRKIRRVPVAAIGGGEKVVRYDSRVKAFSSTSSPVAPGDARSGASRSANQTTTSASNGTGIGNATISCGSTNARRTPACNPRRFQPPPNPHNADSAEYTSSSKLIPSALHPRFTTVYVHSTLLDPIGRASRSAGGCMYRYMYRYLYIHFSTLYQFCN
jgi:hypothetical protein